MARSLESILAPHGYTVRRAADGHEALDQTRSASPDLLLLHDHLPDQPADQLCGTLRLDPRVGNALPIVVVTGAPATRARRMANLRAGAWDVVGMPVDPEELVIRLENFVQAKLEVNRARDEGLVDPLTGLYSVHGFLRRIRETAAGAMRHDRPIACIAIAAEPDRPGEAGEAEAAQEMRRIADALRASSRVYDAVGRLGRTEFAILAPDTDPAGAQRMAERLTRLSEDAMGPRLRAGYFAVPNLKQASIQPAELLVGATMALRRTQSSGPDHRIESFSPTRTSLS